MTTHSGTSYNPMGNPISGGNLTDPPPLEEMFKELARDMQARFDEMDHDMKDLRIETNIGLNYLEHPKRPPPRERRTPLEDLDF